MKKLIVIMALTLIVSGAIAIQKKVTVKCIGDSYVSLLTPDTNYGSARQVISWVKYHYDGTTYSNNDIGIGFLRYAMPTQIIGKVKVLDARGFFFVVYYKGYSPYAAGQATYTFGLYPILYDWDEHTITYNNQPTASGPALYSFSSPKFSSNAHNWIQFNVDQKGIIELQKFVDTGVSYGFALYMDVSPPSGSGTLLAGDYLHEMSVASRENGKLSSFIAMDVDVPTGVLVNGCNINTATLGEVRAKYH
jgi:hypothetical protein